MPLGAIISGVAGLAGIGLSNRAARKENARAHARSVLDQIESLPRLRESAEKAGFNPLTALLATGGSGFGQTGVGPAPLASASAIAGVIEDFGSVVTGDSARDTQRRKVQDRLAELQLERLEAGDAGEVRKRTVAAPAAVRSDPVTYHPNGGGFGPVRTGTVPGAGGVEMTMDPTRTIEHVGPLTQRFTTRDGNTVELPTGPDPEEVMSGVAMEWLADNAVAVDRLKRGGKFVWDMMLPGLNATPGLLDLLNTPPRDAKRPAPVSKPRPAPAPGAAPFHLNPDHMRIIRKQRTMQ